MGQDVEKLQELIDQHDRIVFFGGAGVSTESGIPDFRSKDGLYNQQYTYPPEEILSHTFFINHTKEFYEFYKDKMNSLKYEPNITHIKLTELEQKGILKAIVTQNIDGLHQKAGSKNVLELHGSVHRNYCMKCHAFYDEKFILESEGIPTCPKCGGKVKPDVILYEEGLDNATIEGAIRAISSADLLIIGGTSLVVYPAASFINYYRGKDMVLINKSSTGYDNDASLVINDAIGEVLKEAVLDVYK